MLFKTPHGSRLYGLANENSDEDWYVVVSKVKTARAKYAKQTILDNQDTMLVDFGTWLEQCRSGVPQALEAMFSEQAEWDAIPAFRAAFRVGTGAHERYLRTMTSFALTQDYKRKRHALRLAFNFRDLAAHGRFNPTLTQEQVEYVNLHAHKDTDSVYARAFAIALP